MKSVFLVSGASSFSDEGDDLICSTLMFYTYELVEE
jgi:hypothetical protein